MKTTITSIWHRAAMLLMLVCLTVPLSATVTGTYNSSTKTLIFTGSGNVTQAIVQSVSGYDEAINVTIAQPVTGIDDEAFTSLTKVKTVYIYSPTVAGTTFNSTRNILTRFPYITTLHFGSAVTKIGDFCLYTQPGTTRSLNVILNSTPEIGKWTFYGLDLQNSGTLTVKSVSTGSFARSTLTGIKITDADALGVDVFSNCTKLTSVTLPSNLTTITKYSFRDCTSLASITIPSTVTEIGEYAFWNCTSLNNISLPESLTTLDEYAFLNCTKLTSITLPSALTSFESNAFTGCTALTTLDMKNSRLAGIAYAEASTFADYFPYVTKLIFELGSGSTVGAHFFSGSTTLSSVEIISGASQIDTTAFSGCTALTDVYINDNTLVSHDYDAASNLADVFPYLTNLTLGSSVTTVGKYCFYVAHTESFPLTNVIAANELEISDDAFQSNHSLTSISPIKSVGQGSFRYCTKLTEVTITDDDAIDMCAFEGCSALKDVTLPSTLQKIESYAFADCTALKHILCPVATPIPLEYIVLPFWNVPKDCELCVPAASIPAYKAADVWKDFYYGFPSDGYKLIDGTAYTVSKNKLYPIIRYTRTFSEKTAGNWQCFYVPFDIHITDELLENFNFAELYMASYQDVNGDGKSQADEPLVMVWNKMRTGDLLARNTPYFIKAKNAGTYNIDVENDYLYAARNNNPLTCSTTKHVYSLQGTNEPYDIQNLYTLNTAGQMTFYDTSTILKPNRWWMLIYETATRNPIYSRTINIYVDGEDDPTGIADLKKDIQPSAISVYTIDGVKVNNIDNLPAGIYIINGKKVAVQ